LPPARLERPAGALRARHNERAQDAAVDEAPAGLDLRSQLEVGDVPPFQKM
jgi:hypothetical protein